MFKIIEVISKWALEIIDQSGYLGIFILSLLESAAIPIPSEVVVPFGGFLASTGQLNFWLVVLTATLANLIGAAVIYTIGSFYGQKILEKYGISVEIIDIRSISPLDDLTIVESVKKTGRVVIVHEAPKTSGFGGELAAIIAEEAILYLEAPIVRVAGLDTPFPYTLEHIYLPDAERVALAVWRVMNF